MPGVNLGNIAYCINKRMSIIIIPTKIYKVILQKAFVKELYVRSFKRRRLTTGRRTTWVLLKV